MAAFAQSALPFEGPEPLLYHDIERHGFVMLLSEGSNGKKIQKSHKLASLPAAVEAMRGRTDIWISQGEFFRPSRRLVYLWRMPMAFVDLDTYKVAGLAALSAEAQVDVLLTACVDNQIPPPSLVVFSGRGLQVKWLFLVPVPSAGLARWNVVQRRLNTLLSDIGADHRAMDASRVLRLVGTGSSKSALPVRVVYITTTPTSGGHLMPSGVVGYDFDLLARELLPVARDEIASNRKLHEDERERSISKLAAREAVRSSLVVIAGGPNRASSRLIPSQLAWDRLGDLRTLARLRGYESGLPPGQRNTFVFLGACFLAQSLFVQKLEAEVVALATEFAPGWSSVEVMSCVSSALSRAFAAAKGEKISFRGRDVSPRYRWSNKALVELLEITANEERQLKTIIGATEVKSRDKERKTLARRELGCALRGEWLAERESIRKRSKELKELGWSYRTIAKELNISVGSAHAHCCG